MAVPSLDEFLKPLPPGHVRCTACGDVFHLTPRTRDKGRRQPDSLGFHISGCPECGHVMRCWARACEVRDLTRAEAERLAAHPSFPRIRRVVDTYSTHRSGT